MKRMTIREVVEAGLKTGDKFIGTTGSTLEVTKIVKHSFYPVVKAKVIRASQKYVQSLSLEHDFQSYLELDFITIAGQEV